MIAHLFVSTINFTKTISFYKIFAKRIRHFFKGAGNLLYIGTKAIMVMFLALKPYYET